MSEAKLINGNPHWHKVWEISEFFRAISYSFPEAIVNMSSIHVVSDFSHACGTPACHAGWAALMKDGPRPSKNFYSGADFLARESGWYRGEALVRWADENPKIWGNKYGEAMFSDSCAFTGVAYTVRGMSNPFFGQQRITLKNIADHWLKVAKRLHKLQNGVGL